VTGDERCIIGSLNAGATATCSQEVFYSVTGTYSLWAQVDTDDEVIESHEINNVFGPVGLTVIQNKRVSGSAYFYPESPTYKASFSVDVIGPAAPAGLVKYYYAKTRMNFVSTGITSAAFNGNIATITGTGTVNNVSGYAFTVTVTDGAPDIFGIVIKKSDGSTYYSAGPIPIGGGDLIISGQ
jgi:hypothetical protein